MNAPSSWLPAASEDAMTLLHKHFDSLMLPPAAVDWLLMLWQTIQTFDDYADGDHVDRKALDATIWNTLVAMPQNPFFAQHAGVLLPLLSTAVLKWQAADHVERDKQASAQSYMWRAGYYDLVLMAVQLVHGPAAATSVAHKVLGMYGETFDQYMKEFDHA
jgi:hypothetical protein